MAPITQAGKSHTPDFFMLDAAEPLGHSWPMQLSAYLKAKNMKPGEFAEKIGVHRITVARLCNGTRGISWGLVQRIHAVTKGKVSAKDFLETPLKAGGR